MVATTEHERRINSSTSYIACFKGTDFRRTMLVVFLFCMQIIGGTTLRAYATYFFEQAGLPTEQAFNMSIITYVLSFVGTVLSVRSFWSCLFSQASTLTTGSSEVVSNALHWAANALSLGPLREYCYLLRYWRAGCSQQQQWFLVGNCFSPRDQWLRLLRLHDTHYLCACSRDSVNFTPKQVSSHRPRCLYGDQHRC